MSPPPGVTYEEQDAAGTVGPPLDTAKAFIAGEAERGPTDKPVFIGSPSAYQTTFGGEWAAGYLDDASVIFPIEGASGVWMARTVGLAAKAASVKLSDGSTNTAEVTAANPGAWGNNLKVLVSDVSEGSFTLTVVESGVVKEVERFATVAAAHTWALNSSYIRVTDLGGADPQAAEKDLSGGTDDRSNITDTHRAATLDLFTPDLGPGQILYPGATTSEMWAALLEAGIAGNRRAVLDGADTHTVATLTGACATARALGIPARFGGVWGPWAVGPGSAAGTTKTIPYSIIQAALCARRDLATVDGTLGIGNPNSPAAGVYQDAGVSAWATGLSQEAWTDGERETLNDAGFNVVREVYGRVVTYGYRTLVNPNTDQLNLYFNNSRIDMAIIAASKAIAEEFNFRNVTRRMLGEYRDALITRVLKPYLQVGALFESKPSAEDAYSVDTGEAVNPPKQLSEGIVKAVERAKRSPLAEQNEIIYVKEAL